MVGSRRLSRELALSTLFQADVGGGTVEEALESSLEQGRHPTETLDFARQLVLGTAQHKGHIDSIINKYALGWTLERMTNVDRNILRLAIYELLYLPDIPAGVSVDEAVELAKKYSTAASGRFVNGILGSLARNLESELAEIEAPS